MAKIDEIKRLEDNDIKEDEGTKAAVELHFTIEREDGNLGFVQNAYFDEDKIEEQAQAYADNYEEQYNIANTVEKTEDSE